METKDPAERPARSTGFRPDIEGLRGIAVLVVVLFHCGIAQVPGGFVGVDVFFALSGYLITGLLVSEFEKTSSISLRGFYARRARRLLPASALTLLVTMLIAAILLSPHELYLAGKAARATALYSSNVFFALNTADYFSPSVKDNPVLHTWSLGVEEQFYFFWPLLLMLGLRASRSTRFLCGILSVLTIGSLMISVWLTSHAGSFTFFGLRTGGWEFYSLPSRAWEFGIGGLAALLARGALRIPAVTWSALGWLGAAAILGSVVFFSEGTNFPGWIALIPTGGTAIALIASAERPHTGFGRLLDTPMLQTLGKLSYSWYLWHWPFLVFGAALWPGMTPAFKVAAAAIALAVAAITQRLVENPIRFHPGLTRRPVLSLVLAAGVTIVSFLAASRTMAYGAGLGTSGELKMTADAANDISRLPREQCTSPENTAEVRECSFGDPKAATTVVLFGDSHAIQWFNPVEAIGKSHGWHTITLVKPGCPPTDIRPADDRTDVCSTWRKGAIARISTLRPAFVLMGNASNYMRVRGKGRPVSLSDWQNGSARTMRALNDTGIRVLAFRDTPQPPFDVPNCLGRAARRAPLSKESCSFDRMASLDPAIFEAEKQAAQGLPNIRFIDLTEGVCDDNSCWSFRNGTVVYRDDDHLTGRYADSLSQALDKQIQKLVP